MDRPAISAVVLAGGRGRRFEGRDKGLVDLAGRPLAAWVVDVLRPQAGEIIISANRNHERYAEFADSVVADGIGGYAGPLAGLASAVRVARHERVVVAPCDCPLLPDGLAGKLAACLDGSGKQACVVHDGTRLQPLVGIYRRGLEKNILDYLASGRRRVDEWLEGLDYGVLDYAADPGPFANINTEDDLQAAAARLGDGGVGPR